MKEILNTHSFHDAYIISFECKTIEDYFDYCSVMLKSEDFVEVFGAQSIKVVFKGIFKIISNLQMWVCGDDSIREFYVVKDSSELRELENLKTKGFIPKVDSNFTHFKITLNTSGSVIEIVAQDFIIEMLD